MRLSAEDEPSSEKGHEAVSAVFVSKHSTVRNPRYDGSSLLIEKISCSITQNIKRGSLETRVCVKFSCTIPYPP